MKKKTIFILILGIAVIGFVLFTIRAIITHQQPEIMVYGGPWLGEASEEDPILMPITNSIKPNDSRNLSVGYYNRNSFTAANAMFGVFDCRNESGDFADKDELLTITSKSYDIEPNNDAEYNIIFNENGLSEEIYICTIIVYNSEMVKDITEINKTDINKRGLDYPVYESKQIFLELQRV